MTQQRQLQWFLASLSVLIVVCGSLFRRTYVGAKLQTHGATHFALHAAVYCALMLLFGSMTQSFAKRFAVFVLLVGLAFGTEYYEHLRDTFPIERPDVAADSSGAAGGLIVLSLLDLGGFLVRRTSSREG